MAIYLRRRVYCLERLSELTFLNPRWSWRIRDQGSRLGATDGLGGLLLSAATLVALALLKILVAAISPVTLVAADRMA